MRNVLLLIALAIAAASGCCMLKLHSPFPFVDAPGRETSLPDLQKHDSDQPQNSNRSICSGSVQSPAGNERQNGTDHIS